MYHYRPLFYFLRYTNPTWYFNLHPEGRVCYFPDCDGLSVDDRALLMPDSSFQSDAARKADLSWQAWCKGVIVDENSKALKPELLTFPLIDEYRFIRKYFHSVWSFYVLILRIFSLNAPWKEISAFFKSKNAKRFKVYEQHKDWVPFIADFDSDLIRSKPLISIIIPTLNRYKWLKDVLKDLEMQDYTNFEVLIVDQSEPFDNSFYEGCNLNLRVWNQKEKALWKARNDAIATSAGEFILLYDDDSRVESNWISWHLKSLDFFKSDISSGVSISVSGDKVPENYAFFRWSDQLDTGNVLIKKCVFRQIGLFDRQFEKQRMGDGEFGLRAYLNGFKNISNPQAKRIHLKVGEGGLRQMGSWDGWRPKKWWGPRPIPSILYLYRKYFGKTKAIQMLVQNTLQSLVPYKWKGKTALIIIMFPFSLFLSPIIFLQILVSWNKSSIMLHEGNKIDLLT